MFDLMRVSKSREFDEWRSPSLQTPFTGEINGSQWWVLAVWGRARSGVGPANNPLHRAQRAPAERVGRAVSSPSAVFVR